MEQRTWSPSTESILTPFGSSQLQTGLPERKISRLREEEKDPGIPEDRSILSLLIVQRGQVWQPQVTHFRHIYLIWLLASLFTGGIVCIQGWESGSPDL